jgi:hypothetical protein
MAVRPDDVGDVGESVAAPSRHRWRRPEGHDRRVNVTTHQEAQHDVQVGRIITASHQGTDLRRDQASLLSRLTERAPLPRAPAPRDQYDRCHLRDQGESDRSQVRNGDLRRGQPIERLQCLVPLLFPFQRSRLGQTNDGKTVTIW